MSQSKANEITLMRIEIGMDSATKSAFEEFKAKCSQTLDKLSAIASQTKQADGGLLRAMEAEAANDAPAVECPDDCEAVLKQMGQWVFAGQDDKWQSAGVDCHGRGYLFDCKKERLVTPMLAWMLQPAQGWHFIGDGFDSSNWQQSLINRLPVNDVDYLTEPEDYPDALEQSNWLSESVTPITKTDLESIFIKNLATVLIQRMHSLDRFSEDDYHVGGESLMPWDIVIYKPIDAYAVLVSNVGQYKVADLLFFRDTGAVVDAQWNTESAAFAELRTITQDELDDFRAALEACYVQPK